MRRHVLTVLDYIEQNPGCLLKGPRKLVGGDYDTAMDVLDLLIEHELITISQFRKEKKKRLLIHYYPTKKGVTTITLYRAMCRTEKGDIPTDDPELVELLWKYFGDSYRESIKNTDNIPESSL